MKVFGADAVFLVFLILFGIFMCVEYHSIESFHELKTETFAECCPYKWRDQYTRETNRHYCYGHGDCFEKMGRIADLCGNELECGIFSNYEISTYACEWESAIKNCKMK